MLAEERRARAEARRRTMVLRKTTLHQAEDEEHPLRGAEAISLLSQLTRMAWSMSGRPRPAQDRSEMQVRFIPRDIG